ncbi:hypothetical protein AMATHDRAFT_144287 [Amanita thiersii Skay4041]|uniref:Glycosyltransferase family 32 protein n=1 Tax=Amanita thiersii Skay4041 TaxID=703135 RepID=A0A2A9NSM9_9AGAR|nr:hypothetical protein AMATHDRAFT_144287 [Amanita thiersii Skay4041]
MVTTVRFASSQRPTRARGRLNSINGLPIYSSSSSSAVQEKLALRGLPWWIPVSFSLPGLASPRLQLLALNPRKVHEFTVTRFGRIRGTLLLCLSVLVLTFTTFALAQRFGTQAKQWPTPFTGDPSTLIFKREDLQRIWQWEIASGHYPSRRKIPEQIALRIPPDNPALPPSRHPIAKRTRPFVSNTRGAGPKRVYLDLQSQSPNTAYPPRPVAGSIADMDIIMEHCDFSQKRYVRDCLEVLRVGAGLDNGKRMRRGNMDDWQYIYLEQEGTANTSFPRDANYSDIGSVDFGSDPDSGLSKKRGIDWEKPPIPLPASRRHQVYSSLPSRCDPESPRIFHMFWTGPFTDKPYLTLLSFLFTQNTGLHFASWPKDSLACRPKFHVWINPGPAAAVPNASAVRNMYQELAANPWASPFLHPRFKDVIEFKLWNTTEQLDGVAELREEWRLKDLFNSAGHVVAVPSQVKETDDDGEAAVNMNAGMPGQTGTARRNSEDDILHRTGSKSSSTYDRLSVILSDLARFILCHRFGGIYLDADTILLRDWEEVWGWKGAFAYRWSRLAKYNTAVLHLNKESALGKFLFKTALKNGLDFHPMTVSRYLKDAHLEELLFRLPDALFDPAWLNTEGYQIHRPPQPLFTSFEDFFATPVLDSAAPQVLGFDGFFKGAFSYHYHNFWWRPFDPARNWPDLGLRFIAGERIARQAARKSVGLVTTPNDETDEEVEEKVEDDRRDLDWATVLKRTCEAYIRGERPSMYGEWLVW